MSTEHKSMPVLALPTSTNIQKMYTDRFSSFSKGIRDLTA